MPINLYEFEKLTNLMQLKLQVETTKLRIYLETNCFLEKIIINFLALLRPSTTYLYDTIYGFLENRFETVRPKYPW